jgi:hypothetical protein
MIELAYILRAIKEPRSISFEELERFIYDQLWRQDRISIYSTSLELDEDLRRLANLGAIEYDGKTITIVPNTFRERTRQIVETAEWMIAGNAYLKYVIDVIKRRAEEFAERGAAQAAV